MFFLLTPWRATGADVPSAGWRATVETDGPGRPFDLPVPVPGTRATEIRSRRLVLDARTDVAALELGGTTPAAPSGGRAPR